MGEGMAFFGRGLCSSGLDSWWFEFPLLRRVGCKRDFDVHASDGALGVCSLLSLIGITLDSRGFYTLD